MKILLLSILLWYYFNFNLAKIEHDELNDELEEFLTDLETFMYSDGSKRKVTNETERYNNIRLFFDNVLSEVGLDKLTPPELTARLQAIQQLIASTRTEITTTQNELTSCESSLATCESNLKTTLYNLGVATADTITCFANLATCNTNLGSTTNAYNAAVAANTLCQTNTTNCLNTLVPGVTANIAACTPVRDTCLANLQTCITALSTYTM